MSKNASLQQLIDLCELKGWDNVINSLEKIVLANESAQAYLYGGDYNEIRKAQKLSKTIIQQNFTIGRLKRLRLEREQKKS